MQPYLCVTQATKDDDIKRMYIKINHPGVAPIEIEISPVQAILLAADLLQHFPIGKINND